jgi:plastocyanin
MTSLSRIFFSLIAALPVAAATIIGQVELRDSREASVRKSHHYSGVVISLVRAGGAAADVHGLRTARMIQKHKMFSPHVLPIEVGTSVEFPNYDPIFHNAFSNYDGQVFDVGLYPPGTSRNVLFKRPGVVRVFCNIHSAMSAVIVVVPTPWFAASGPAGNFEIRNVPEGEYDLRVFHERATAATLQALARRLAVSGETVTLPAMLISESGFLTIPHMNKYGGDYGPQNGGSIVYPETGK